MQDHGIWEPALQGLYGSSSLFVLCFFNDDEILLYQKEEQKRRE
jgi:hypothetical protein